MRCVFYVIYYILLDVGGKIIAMWTLEKKFAILWGGFVWLRRGSIKGLL
jgi:hypothetical protein